MKGTEPSTSETLLLAVCSQPLDADAWSRFVFLYGPHVVTWCRRYGIQEADARDVAQEVLLRFSKQAARFRYDRSKKFRGYLRAITHAAWCEWAERKREVVEGTGGSAMIGLLEQIPARDDLIAEIEAEYDRELLRLAMGLVKRRVEPRTWEVFRLLAIEGLPGIEAAARVGMKLGSAFAARHKVQRMLKETIEGLDT